MKLQNKKNLFLLTILFSQVINDLKLNSISSCLTR